MNDQACNRVGFWWSDKKSRKLNCNEFSAVCRTYGLEAVKLDLDQPLEEQGPFKAIVHKLSDMIVKAESGDEQSKFVVQEFQKYVDAHPEIVLVDPLANVKKLLNRSREYKLVANSELQEQGDVFIPAFVELTTMNISENLEKMKAAGIDFPVVCKPSLSHGSTLAHQMCLIFNEEGLKDISPPCVMQKFINHNAILYKLFIIDDKYFIFERPSLKNFKAGNQKTIFFDSHEVSKPHSASFLTELDDTEPESPVIWPDKNKMDRLVEIVCKHLGLTLFGIDVIVDNKTGHYAIIDMNIFPGYVEVHNFFHLLCDTLVKRIASHSQSSAEMNFKPVLSNPKSMSEINKFTFNRNPYFPKCFCCPITGCCSNGPQLVNTATQTTSVAEECNPTSTIASPDAMQDDSGIETSDSCDEKKKDCTSRTVRRQHSRNYVPAFANGNIITVEESG